MVVIVMVIVLGEGEAVSHVLRMDFGAFVAVVVMVVVAVVVMVIVAVVIMVVIAMLIVTVIVVVGVCAPHLQHDKIEGFDARGFEFEHVLAFFKAVDVNHRVRGTSLGAVDAFLSGVVLVTLVVVVFLMLVLIVMRFGNHRVVHGGRRPSDVFGLVQHHVIDANLADVPVVAGLVPHVEGPVPGGVGLDTADACDHVAPSAERGVPSDVVGTEGCGGQVPAGGVFRPVSVIFDLKRHRGVVWVVNNHHVVVFFVILVVIVLFRGEIHRFVRAFVEVLAKVSDEHRLKLKREVTVRHGVGGHRLWG